jgi:hypothetical protein
LPDGRLFVAPETSHEVMSRRPGLFNEALAGFFRSTEVTARKRAEAATRSAEHVGHAAAMSAARRQEESPLSVPVPPDDQSDVDWLADSSR